MTDEERARWYKEMQALDDQISLQLKQAKTEFWKVGIALLAAGGLVGGTIVGLLTAT